MRNAAPQDSQLTVNADEKTFTMRARIDTPFELAVFLDGGILPFTLRRLAQAGTV